MNKKPVKGEYLETLLRSPKTVFTTKDIALLWREDNSAIIAARLHQYVKTGKLLRIRRSLYAKDANYNRFEMATRIYTPAYISFETVLTRSGVNFQYYGNIFVASYLTRDIEVDSQKISLVRMRDYILCNTVGIDHTSGVAMATKERAFLDRIYVTKEYHFDNLNVLDWNKVFEMLPLYQSKRMTRKVQKYFEHYKNANS